MTHRSDKNKSKHTSLKQNLRQINQPKEFRIDQPGQQPGPEDYNAIRLLIQRFLTTQAPQRTTTPAAPNPQLEELLHLLANLATGVWRARLKMLAPSTDQPLEELRRAFRPLDTAYQSMLQGGIEVVDRIHQPYATGLGEKVIAFEPASGINRETVIETVKPAIYYRGQLLQQGEIIVGTPKSATSPAPTNPNTGG